MCTLAPDDYTNNIGQAFIVYQLWPPKVQIDNQAQRKRKQKREREKTWTPEDFMILAKDNYMRGIYSA